jgi:repressor LexA
MVALHMEINSMFQAPFSRPVEFFSSYRAPIMAWHQRLQAALKEKGWSKAELSRRSGVPYDNVNKYVDGTVKQPRGDALEKLARALDLDPLFLEHGLDPTTGETQVPVMGYLGAGSEVEPDFEQIPPEGLEQVSIPFTLPDDMIAFKVRGDSMLPVFRDGAVIVVFREQKKPTEAFFGEEAAVRTEDGRRFIKTIMRGQRAGTVNLLSWNAGPIENVAPTWLGEIFAVLPPAALRKVARQGGVQGQLGLRRA